MYHWRDDETGAARRICDEIQIRHDVRPWLTDGLLVDSGKSGARHGQLHMKSAHTERHGTHQRLLHNLLKLHVTAHD